MFGGGFDGLHEECVFSIFLKRSMNRMSGKIGILGFSLYCTYLDWIHFRGAKGMNYGGFWVERCTLVHLDFYSFARFVYMKLR